MADDDEMPKTTYEYLDGEQETAEWLSRAGKCKITYPSGAIYEGQVNDLKQKHGLGKYTYPAEPKEDGEEEEEDAEEAPRTVYEGEWLNGSKSGTGATLYANGDAYYGQFKNNKPNGPVLCPICWPSLGRYWLINTPNTMGNKVIKNSRFNISISGISINMASL